MPRLKTHKGLAGTLKGKMCISCGFVTNNLDVFKGTVNRSQTCRDVMPNILEYFNVTPDYEALLFILNILSQSHF
jgi:hypothetical protein